jgi:hypothetical protein
VNRAFSHGSSVWYASYVVGWVSWDSTIAPGTVLRSTSAITRAMCAASDRPLWFQSHGSTFQ